MLTILSIDLIRQWWSTWPGLLKVVSTRRWSRRQSRASTAALESRKLLVGTVTSTFVNGSLTLRGDDAANDITVLFLTDQVTIVGNEDIFGNKTVIAGVTSAKVTGTLTIDLGLGSSVAP